MLGQIMMIATYRIAMVLKSVLVKVSVLAVAAWYQKYREKVVPVHL